MTEVPDRARRAFRDHDAFDPSAKPGAFAAVTTPFDAEVRAGEGTDGRIEFAVEVRVPRLSTVVEGEVADVVEEGWAETFELRVTDPGGVTRGDRDLDPSVRAVDGALVVTVGFEDVDPRRGVADALALVNFVEGTYVQGVIPGYEYTEPVAGILAEARRAAGAED
ncbi:MAG: DUF5813 family protein [Haloferacaceae archaeon]